MTDDFLTPPEEKSAPRVWTVSELTRGVRAAIEQGVGAVWVEGEISNLRKQASGHQYFTLKDEASQLSCVLFARGQWSRGPALSDGMKVVARGQMTVYEARGQYQLNVQSVQAAGAGLLQAKFDALKRRLAAEGLFDEERKRPLPEFPTTVALVTSPTGAALRDMLNILARRAPWVRVVVSPVRVQGEGAAEEIAAAIAELNAHSGGALPVIDVIVAGRGGGSIEDLWEFNEEMVARAIADSEIPVVSAVGHEIDFTIADFAADLRAPTPSAAAELIVPDGGELSRTVAGHRQRMGYLLENSARLFRERLDALARLVSPRELIRRLEEAAQRLDSTREELARCADGRFDQGRTTVRELAALLEARRPDQALALARQRLDRLRDILRVLSPQATLERGYTITFDAAGQPITSAGAAGQGARLRTRFADGEVESVVGVKN